MAASGAASRALRLCAGALLKAGFVVWLYLITTRLCGLCSAEKPAFSAGNRVRNVLRPKGRKGRKAKLGVPLLARWYKKGKRSMVKGVYLWH